ncbi:hypothetical protein [Thermus scotoductus]|uniref:hypothetical protein n=1 Tax=Thermus scotoductus TaxID=37636 RepID=UPI000F8099A2|nr:hypothetical protein [Thermus scotoductus]
MVEHLIVFNAEASPEEVREMVKKAEEVLLQIPGVCGLRYGEALSEGAPCFLPPCGAATTSPSTWTPRRSLGGSGR